MTKSKKLVKKRHKIVNLSEKKLQHSEKRHQNVNLGDKIGQTSEKDSQTSENKWQNVIN